VKYFPKMAPFVNQSKIPPSPVQNNKIVESEHIILLYKVGKIKNNEGFFPFCKGAVGGLRGWRLCEKFRRDFFSAVSSSQRQMRTLTLLWDLKM